MNKFKKIFLLILALSMIFLTGCGTSGSFNEADYSIAPQGSWKDGTYTEQAEGKNGNFDVTVTISSGNIADIKIVDNNETPDKGGVAINTLPDEIIESQSPSVDAVSGATVTSNAIKTAVAKCLQDASEQ